MPKVKIVEFAVHDALSHQHLTRFPLIYEVLI